MSQIGDNSRGLKKGEAPNEPFKRAVAASLRAIARTPDPRRHLRGRQARAWPATGCACPSRRAG